MTREELERTGHADDSGEYMSEGDLDRYYVLTRQYDDIEVGGLRFQAFAEVDASVKRGEDWIEVTEIGDITLISEEGWEFVVPGQFLDSYYGGDTWRAKIEREICIQAEELPKSEWRSEYAQGDKR